MKTHYSRNALVKIISACLGCRVFSLCCEIQDNFSPNSPMSPLIHYWLESAQAFAI